MSDARRVLAVIVLYRLRAEESAAYQSMRAALAADAGLEDQIELMLFDNSPDAQPTPAGFHGTYLRDQTNPGVAGAYNAALTQARGSEWLMLLDQDTTVTREYLAEVVHETTRAAAAICAFVPRLLSGSAILSPLIPPFSPAGEITDALYGVPGRPLHMFNSGAVLRVPSLDAIGGFPAGFPVDSLDHATFHLLQAAGGQVFVLRAGLQHTLAHDQGPISAARQRSILAGQMLYYRRFGTALEQRSFRRDLLRRALVAMRSAEFAQAGRLLLAAARSGGPSL